jgi:hypothetical protein
VDQRDQIKAVTQIAEIQKQFLAGLEMFNKLIDVLQGMATSLDGMNQKLDRMATSLEGLDQSVKLIQEVMNNPTDDIPTGIAVKPAPPNPNP